MNTIKAAEALDEAVKREEALLEGQYKMAKFYNENNMPEEYESIMKGIAVLEKTIEQNKETAQHIRDTASK